MCNCDLAACISDCYLLLQIRFTGAFVCGLELLLVFYPLSALCFICYKTYDYGQDFQFITKTKHKTKDKIVDEYEYMKHIFELRMKD